MKRLPVIAFTMGDPSGIGPEIAVKAISSFHLHELAGIRVYGSPDILREARERFAPDAVFQTVPCGTMQFSSVHPGKLDPAAGLEAYAAVSAATKDALSGVVDAVVTCPMNKAAVNEAGIPFTGHTELIAGLCGTEHFAMMQSAGKLHIAFATTHIPLKEVAAVLTVERIEETVRLLAEVLKEEGIQAPRIAIAALNPHAGENGHMGMEDEEVVKPAVSSLLKSGLDVEGPFPPDTLFIRNTRERFDGIVSMYHDQGHIPFKMLAFDRGVNSTLGIPIIRTSVDHGTAFEIAWKGVADTGSLHEAFRLALIRAEHRKWKKGGSTPHV